MAGLVVVFVALVTTSGAVYLIQRATLDSHLQEVLADRVHMARDAADEHADPEALIAALDRRGLRAWLTTSDGRRLVTAPVSPRVGRNLPVPPGLTDLRIITRTFETADHALVTVGVSRDGVDAALRRLLRLQLLTAALVLPLAGFLLQRATLLSLQSLDIFVRAANRIAAGDHSHRVSGVDHGSELDQAARAFNHMLDELEQALSAARSSEHRTRGFLDAAAHQLRTPIASAAASVQTLLHHSAPEKRDELLLRASRETARAGKMVAGLLRIARLDEGVSLQMRPTRLGRLIEEEAERTRQRAPHLQILTDLDAADGCQSLCDASATSESLANLLDNAARHTRDRITVRLEAGDDVRIAVRDDGPGVPEAARDRIFERFVTLDNRGGTGLGLAIARDLAIAQGGNLAYDGGAFVLSLPETPV